jgi:uncharacterized protein with GYD domain
MSGVATRARNGSHQAGAVSVTAARHTTESLGGSLECIYWGRGTRDGYAIADLPDSVTAGALKATLTRTGAFKSVETHELLTQQQLRETLDLARGAKQVYEVPGEQA